MGTFNRRQFFQLAGLATVAGSIRFPDAIAASEPALAPTLGVASYSLRKFKTADAIAMTKRIGATRICFKDVHLPLESSEEEIHNALSLVRSAGLELYGVGVIYMKDEKSVHQAFAYARAASVRMIIGAPDVELLGLCEQKVKETDVMLAIHNHGPDNPLYPGPGDAYALIRDMDRRVGLCMDIGHTMRNGQDPAEAAKKYIDRLHDIHIKDVTEASKAGQPAEIGRGVIDIPKFLRTIFKLKYRGVLALEYEKDADDPLPGMAESIGYLKGVLADLRN